MWRRAALHGPSGKPRQNGFVESLSERFRDEHPFRGSLQAPRDLVERATSSLGLADGIPNVL